MPHPSKTKGTRVEREIVDLHKGIGVNAHRVPLSGAAGGQYAGDLRIPICDKVHSGEVKARKTGGGFVQIEKWLGKNDFLFLKRDRTEPMVVMTWDTYVELLTRIPGIKVAVVASEPVPPPADLLPSTTSCFP